MFLMAVVSTPLSYGCSLFLFLFAFVYASPILYFLLVTKKKAVLKYYYFYLYVCHSKVRDVFTLAQCAGISYAS
jgi:hypothetical protein